MSRSKKIIKGKTIIGKCKQTIIYFISRLTTYKASMEVKTQTHTQKIISTKIKQGVTKWKDIKYDIIYLKCVCGGDNLVLLECVKLKQPST